MNIDFKETFFPSTETLIKRYEKVLNLYKEYVGECCTCKNYIPPYPHIPGYIVDFGECSVKNEIFFIKICGRGIECSDYKEDTGILDEIKKGIKQLRGEMNGYNQHI